MKYWHGILPHLLHKGLPLVSCPTRWSLSLLFGFRFWCITSQLSERLPHPLHKGLPYAPNIANVCLYKYCHEIFHWNIAMEYCHMFCTRVYLVLPALQIFANCTTIVEYCQDPLELAKICANSGVANLYKGVAALVVMSSAVKELWWSARKMSERDSDIDDYKAMNRERVQSAWPMVDWRRQRRSALTPLSFVQTVW